MEFGVEEEGFGNVRSGQDTYGTVLVDDKMMLAIAGKLEKGSNGETGSGVSGKTWRRSCSFSRVKNSVQ